MHVDPEVQDTVVEALHPIRYKDLPTSGFGPLESFVENCRVVNKRTSSGIILNTARCLQSSSLSWMQRELGIPMYALGPLHASAKAVKSSVLEEDMGCIEWLNKQKPSSVIYISLGSVVIMEIKEVLEMAWGLYNSNQPFLWVIRPGCIVGSEIESLPEESIEEGVPIICRPFQGQQKLNAMYLESVWRIGFQLGGEVERGNVESAVKRLIVEEEGADMKRRALDLKQKIKDSVRIGGSSYKAFDEFVKYLKGESEEAVLKQRIR
ncbi:hypothetical protein N665_0369s0012 [Sinapis alba]|nr:hypothetical protein N665_0369s0012 [Sinapis alba]